MRLLLTAVMLCAICTTAEAQPPVPAHEWDSATRLDLARCLVAERNWDAWTEWAAIAHVLAKRWRSWEGRESFHRRIRRYCAVHKARTPTARQQWVRALPAGRLESDPGFPPDVDWRNYVEHWNEVQRFVHLFEHGLIVDPLPEARYFASQQDLQRRSGRYIFMPTIIPDILTGEPVRLRNRFYTPDRRRSRSERMREVS